MAKARAKGKGVVANGAIPSPPVEATTADAAPESAAPEAPEPEAAATAPEAPATSSRWVTLDRNMNIAIGGQLLQFRQGRTWVEPQVLAALVSAGVNVTEG